ncbi:MAG TPA: chorismate-binding protein [Limnochordales bacterium]
MHIHPSPQQARELLERGEVVVLSSAFIADGLTPTAALARLGPQPLGRFLLESAEQGERVGRYSFVGAGVRELVAFDGTHGFAFGWEPSSGGQVVERARWPQRDILAELRARLSDLRCPAQPDLPPFFGGAVGFLGYDVVRTIEHLPDGRPDPVGSWTAGFLVADVVVAFDHFRRLAYLLALCRRQEGETARQAYEQAAGRLEEVRWRLARSPAGELEPPLLEAPQWATPVPAPPEDPHFVEAVRRAKEYIRAGDIFQVVLSRHTRVPCPQPPLAVYRRLRAINPSPYMFYLELADPRPGGAALHLVGASPEVMVRLQGRRACLRPIAGTRPRGRSEAEEQALARQLAEDPKELAEHMMLVDLGRNDLGRVCRFGTVRVTQLLTVERYSHVMHLVSEVEGELAEGQDAFDLMRAVFPAGTVTGAPKVRAMEIIDELEQEGRGFYAGAVGYFAASGDADSCITIRSLAICRGVAHARAGAGIVADSDPVRELWETHHKVSAVLSALACQGQPVAAAAGGEGRA